VKVWVYNRKHPGIRITRLAVAGLCCLASLAAGPLRLPAQDTVDDVVQLSAVVLTNPPLIAITWHPSADALRYEVYRKERDGSSWGPAIATLAAEASQYADSNVLTGVAYAYRVSKADNHHGGEGFIYCGIPGSPADLGGKPPYLGGISPAANQFSAEGGGGSGGGSSGGGGGLGGLYPPVGTNGYGGGLYIGFYPPGNGGGGLHSGGGGLVGGSSGGLGGGSDGGSGSGDLGGSGILYGLTSDGQGLVGNGNAAGFMPEPAIYAAAASACALLALWRIRLRQKQD
jgi:hypothetical protein